MIKKRMKTKVNESDKENKNPHLAFVKIILKSPVKNIKFSKDRVSLDFFNHRISDKITIKREVHVAEWSRKRREVFIDKNFGEKEKEKSFKALCIHELIEGFLVKEFGLKVD